MLLLLEGTSFVTLSTVHGPWASFQKLADDRASILAETRQSPFALPGVRSGISEYSLFHHPSPRFLPFTREILHPYVGTVREPRQFGGTGAYYGFAEEHGTLSTQANPQTFVLGILGGSFAEFFALDGGDLLAEMLEEHPAMKGKTVRVVSLALAGHKQPQQLMTVAYILSLGIHLDAVINIDGFNEILLPLHENLPKSVSPFYPRQWFSRIGSANNAALFPVIGQIAWMNQRRSYWAERAGIVPLRYSMTVQFLWQFYDTVLLRRIVRRMELLQSIEPEQEQAYITTGPSYEVQGEQAIIRDLAKHWATNSILLRRLSEANDITYVHVLQPNLHVSGSKQRTPEEEIIAAAGAFPKTSWVEAGYRALREEGKNLLENGEHFIDLSMVFRSVRAPLYYDCCHVIPEGSQIITQAIAEVMLKVLEH